MPKILGPRIIGNPFWPVGSVRACDKCGDQVERLITAPNAAGVQMLYWSDCQCTNRIAAMQQHSVEQAARRQAEIDEARLGDPGARRIKGLTLDMFDPSVLKRVSGSHPYDRASAWLAMILEAGESQRTMTPLARRLAEARGEVVPDTPAPALYFYSPGKGRGKTHLAAACYWEAKRLHKRVAFVEELSYLGLVWNLPFGPDRDAAIALPAEQAWLTVIDDLGRRDPGRANVGTQNAWGDIIGRRVGSGRWTIFTSNYTPDELVQRGTIDEATYSRICQMTGNSIVFFDGADQRQVKE